MTLARFTPLAGVLALLWAHDASGQVLYRYVQATLFDGRYGPLALAQEKANAGLLACGKQATITVDGKFGQGTRQALADLAKCPAFASLKSDADAQAGALTLAYWTALVGGAAPGVDARARTVMLTYEATDYTRMEWNFCQSKPIYNPSAGNQVCYSNDPRSYLTWGPNGATAGGGREVQLILQAVDAASPAVLDQGFGSEAVAVRRTFRLADRTAGRNLETYLCGIWTDPVRRARWKMGFEAVGRQPDVRARFDALYRSASLDGGKIRTFMAAYAAKGRVPTEIDYAFFKDRSAHMSVSADPIRQAIAVALEADPQAPAWKIRRTIALRIRAGNPDQQKDRLGRDVAFYIDSAGLNGLSAEERTAWTARNKLRASDAGLSDSRAFADFSAGPAIDTTIPNPDTLTAAERAMCPAAVLATRSPPKP